MPADIHRSCNTSARDVSNCFGSEKTAASLSLWLWGGSWSWSAMTLEEEGLSWVSVAEMPFVNAALLDSLLASCPEHPKWWVHPCKGWLLILCSPLAVPPPRGMEFPFEIIFSSLLLVAWLLVQLGQGNSGVQGGSFSAYCIQRGMWNISLAKVSFIKGLFSQPSSCLIFRAAEECFLLFGAGYCGMHTTKECARGVGSCVLWVQDGT